MITARSGSPIVSIFVNVAQKNFLQYKILLCKNLTTIEVKCKRGKKIHLCLQTQETLTTIGLPEIVF